MLITKIKRTYSKSVNSKNYGLPESWVRIEAEFEGVPETGEDPIYLSEILFDSAKKQVMSDADEIIGKMKEAAQSMRNMAAGVVPGAVIAPVPTPATTPAPANAPGNPLVPTRAPLEVQTNPLGTGVIPKETEQMVTVKEKNSFGPITVAPSDDVSDDDSIKKAVDVLTENGKNPGGLFHENPVLKKIVDNVNSPVTPSEPRQL